MPHALDSSMCILDATVPYLLVVGSSGLVRLHNAKRPGTHATQEPGISTIWS
jgi:hypothetical protein